MTPQRGLEIVIISAFGILFSAAMGLLCLRFHWRGESLFFACFGLFCAAALVDMEKKRRRMLQGGQVFVPAPPSIHIVRAVLSVAVVFFFLCTVSLTAYFFWQSRSVVQPFPSFVWWIIVPPWAFLFGLYWLASSKSLLLWSSLPQNSGPWASVGKDPLPPLTIRGMTGPILSAIGFGLFIGCLVGFLLSSSGGHRWFGHILFDLLGGLAGGGVLAVLYIALVAGLRKWNAHTSRTMPHDADGSAEQIWPPSPQVPDE